MSRRASHANITGIRRGSIIDPTRAKRVSLKDGTLGYLGPGRLAGVAEIKEGDVYYKTERVYPSIPDHPEDVYVTTAKWSHETRTGSIGNINRDDTVTPSDIGHGYDRDR